ncbi:tRNA (cytidine(34)-2'-O)-methyltransferase [Roseitalea porphyridii]|uniref:tRNA (cytidine(34)-2'-O)-methyltransferase n=1 Tax=Roseitalea porphyridii TaxID=1852022 RepID=A0A4P6V2H2_9HYPH|nr:tRNA (cytidine(34)-2'-O)-methyltransferase [Roseitalea porphyridii]QBK31592.1 tRNA (cytidine(34)-2'-O)-methyltransferase [Roseitalea porphyridii]
MTSSPAPQHPTFHVALYQPDIAGNTGSILRTAACLGFVVHLIGPAGFDASDRALRRAGMDYLAMAALTRHDDWAAFEAWRRDQDLRLALLTTKGATPHTDHAFAPGEVLLFGSESAGVPGHVHETADARLTIPMMPGARSLNLAVSVGIVAAEALRQHRAR